jgi:CubicO group peptidase (beta-lactamase class C family)
LHAVAVNGQAGQSDFKQVNDTVIAKFNRGDYKGIYAMAGDAYKAQTQQGSLVNDLKDDKKTIGKVVSSTITEDLGKVKHFKWLGENANLNFELWMDGVTIIRFKFNDLTTQPGWADIPVKTDNRLTTSLDSIVQIYAARYMASPKAVGLSIGIYLNGKKYSYNYGEVEKGSGKLPNGKTIYSLGSVTKTFIGILLAKAVLEHKLTLQDDIRKYLQGDFPNLAYQGHPVRLIDLATHSWGFNRWRLNVFPANYESMSAAEQLRYYDAYTKDSLYRDLHLAKIDTLPGVRYHYNIGSMLLIGMALEKVYQQPLDQIVRDYYRKTFQMPDTKLISDAADLTRYAKGYNEKGELMPPIPHATPSLYTTKTTTADMLNYLEANVLEKDPAIKLSHQPAWGNPKSFSLGLFWQVTDDPGQGRWIKHSGYDSGSITLCSVHPEEKLGIIIWANDDSRQNNLFDIERNIREHILYLRSPTGKN